MKMSGGRRGFSAAFFLFAGVGTGGCLPINEGAPDAAVSPFPDAKKELIVRDGLPFDRSSVEVPAIPPCDLAAGCDPLTATSKDYPPWGLWSMLILYSSPMQPAVPIPALQLDLRPDGNAYTWVCDGASSDGLWTATCPPDRRKTCFVGTVAWDGKTWRVDFPHAAVRGATGQGIITPDGNGNILVGYIYYTFSGGLLRRTDDPGTGAAGCTEVPTSGI